MTEQQKEQLREFERGHRLAHLMRTDGYKELLDLMEEEVVKWEFRLMNLPPGTADTLLRDIHTAARIARSQFEQLQLRLTALVDAAIPTEPLELDESGLRDRSEYLS